MRRLVASILGIPSRALIIALIALIALIGGCTGGDAPGDGDESKTSELDEIVTHLQKHADARILQGDDGAKVIVSAKLQGRIMTASVGAVASTGFVNKKAIAEGETHDHFNNFGGMDRFWIGPEAGQYGVYFPAGAELNRDTWQVPAAFDKGPFKVITQLETQISMQREMEVTNYSGTTFKVRVDREVGIIPKARLESELGVALPAGGVLRRLLLRQRHDEP